MLEMGTRVGGHGSRVERLPHDSPYVGSVLGQHMKLQVAPCGQASILWQLLSNSV